jgi:pimeloyl-ACP methyl ester carboxylesterase
VSNATHETAPTEFVQVGDVRFAYRRFGRPGGLPLLLLNYFAATLDDWDPLVTNGLGCEREVVLFDNAGVGSSTGDTPPTVSAMTKDCVDFCRALDLLSFDLMRFSLGGMIAQQLAQADPDMIRRMILLGTGPRGGEGMTFTELSVDELDDQAIGPSRCCYRFSLAVTRWPSDRPAEGPEIEARVRFGARRVVPVDRAERRLPVL